MYSDGNWTHLLSPSVWPGKRKGCPYTVVPSSVCSLFHTYIHYRAIGFMVYLNRASSRWKDEQTSQLGALCRYSLPSRPSDLRRRLLPIQTREHPGAMSMKVNIQQIKTPTWMWLLILPAVCWTRYCGCCMPLENIC